MRILAAVLFLGFASEASAECGNLCDRGWWAYKTVEDLQSELDAGASTSAFDKDGWTALHHAAGVGELEHVEVILALGADVNAAIDQGYGLKMTALHPASWYGPFDNVKALLAAGADVSVQDINGWTPLHHAARRDGHIDFAGNSTETIQALLNAGAKLEAKSNYGETPLHISVTSATINYSSYADSPELGAENLLALLAAGADIKAKDNEGNTALHRAVIEGYAGYIPFLLTAGADILVVDNNGFSALHLAAFWRREESIQVLLAAGADPKVKDKSGKTPLDLAQNSEELIDTEAYNALKTATCGEANWFKSLFAKFG